MPQNSEICLKVSAVSSISQTAVALGRDIIKPFLSGASALATGAHLFKVTAVWTGPENLDQVSQVFFELHITILVRQEYRE